jgi:hypothetical protein
VFAMVWLSVLTRDRESPENMNMSISRNVAMALLTEAASLMLLYFFEFICKK